MNEANQAPPKGNISPADLLKKAANPESAAQPEPKEELQGKKHPFGMYQLFSAPCSLQLPGKKTLTSYPDGVAVPETEEEYEFFESLLAVGNCTRYIEGAEAVGFQKVPNPINPTGTN